MNALILALALITSEQSYGPYARPMNGADATIAPARGGALLAWSEGSRIRFGMLDAHARLGEKIQTLPASSDRAIALAPAAASSGASFLVAWIELGAGTERVMAMSVGVDGTPLGAPRAYGGAVPIVTNEFALRLVWDGAAYRLWASGWMFTIDAYGNPLASAGVTSLPQGVAARNGVLCTSTVKITSTCGFGWCSRMYDLLWTAGTATGSVRLGSTSGPAYPPQPSLVMSPSVMAAANHRFAIAWTNPSGVRYLMTGDGENLVSATAETSVKPGLACDDAQCVLAYGQSGDVHAFAFPIDRLTGPELMTITATERVERVPQVHNLGPGRFLVLYRSDGLDGARMNWRVVSFGTPPRRRAVH